eukprot:9271349-Lingulodinium_polyedra.AAC.1
MFAMLQKCAPASKVPITSKDFLENPKAWYFTECWSEEEARLTDGDSSINVWNQFVKAKVHEKLRQDKGQLLLLAEPLPVHAAWKLPP